MSRTGTINAVIAAWEADDPDEVLKWFDDDAAIVGTKAYEVWHGKADAPLGVTIKKAIETDMAAFHLGGSLLRPAADAEFSRITNSVYRFDREGTLVIVDRAETADGQRGRMRHGRWTATLRKESGDNWKIAQSHFALIEGQTVL